MKNKITLKNLTDKQKQGLKDGSLSIAALLSGAGLFSLFGNATVSPTTDETAPPVEDDITDNEIHPISGESTDLIEECPILDEAVSESLVIETDAEFATGNFDALSFGGAEGAFAAARESVGPGGFFEWRGQTYNTYTQEEWDSMNGEQLQDYASNLESNSNYDSFEFVETPQFASQSYDLNNDGITDVVMSDIDGDGTLEVDQVDLNSDGHLDVVHVVGQDDTNQIEARASESLQEAEPVFGVDDHNQDGIIDAVALDSNNDGYADTVIFDNNYDGEADALGMNIGDDQDLDIIIIDENHNGQLDDGEVELIEEELRMDEFIIISEEELENVADDTPQTNQNELLIGEADVDIDDFDTLEL